MKVKKTMIQFHKFHKLCKLADIEACSLNEACVQTNVKDKESGECLCLDGYFRNDNHVSER